MRKEGCLMRTPYSVSINMGKSCNFRCSYCFEVKNGSVESTDKLQSNVKKRVIEVLHLLADMHDLRIEFWGAEPTIYFHDIYDIINEFVDNEHVTFFLYTNGSLVQNLKDKLLEINDKVGERLQIQVSYDYHNIEDNQRFQLNKTIEETDKIVRDAIKFFDENDFNFGTKSTCTMKDLEENLYQQYINFENFNKELKHKVRFVLTPDTLNAGNIDYDKMHKQFIKLIKYFLKYKQFGKTGFMWFDMNANADCSGGANSFQVDLDGKVTYCHGCLYGKEDMFYTTIFDDNFLHKVDFNYLVQNNLFKKQKQCQDCTSVFCFRCNAVNCGGDIEYWDAPNKKEVCKLYNKISDYIKAYKQMATA